MEGLSAIAIESTALGTAPVLPDYTPIPDEVKELSIVRDVEDIPKAIASIASGRVKYKVPAYHFRIEACVLIQVVQYLLSVHFIVYLLERKYIKIFPF